MAITGEAKECAVFSMVRDGKVILIDDQNGDDTDQFSKSNISPLFAGNCRVTRKSKISVLAVGQYGLWLVGQFLISQDVGLLFGRDRIESINSYVACRYRSIVDHVSSTPE